MDKLILPTGKAPVETLLHVQLEFTTEARCILALASDLFTKEIVAYAISEHPDLAQQDELLRMLLLRVPPDARPVLRSDMGWQYQHVFYQQKVAAGGVEQSMSRKGNRLDNAATEQVFGHLKDEFFRGLDTPNFAEFKNGLSSYIVPWNTRRRQFKPRG